MRVSRLIVVERLFPEGYVFDRSCSSISNKLGKAIDPKPTHLSEFRFDVTAQIADRQQIAKILNAWILFKLGEVCPGHSLL